MFLCAEDEDRKTLIQDFKTSLLRRKQSFPNLEKRLQVFIADCEHLGVEATSPWLELGLAFDENGDYEQALQTFQTITEKFPFAPRGWRGLSIAYINLKRYSEALKSLDKALCLTQKISDLVEDLNPDEKESLKIYSRDSHLKFIDDIQLQIGFCNHQIGNSSQGLSWYQTVYNSNWSENKNNPPLFISLASCYEQLGYNELRGQILNEGQQLFPTHLRLNNELARYYFEEEYFDLAIDCYEFLIGQKFEIVKCYAELLMTLKISNLKYTFEQRLEEALQLKPASKEDDYHFGHIQFMAGNQRLAKQYFQKSESKEMSYYEIWRLLRPFLDKPLWETIPRRRNYLQSVGVFIFIFFLFRCC